MFQNTFQSGLLSILYSIGNKPLQLWEKTTENDHLNKKKNNIRRIVDEEIQSSVLELVSGNLSKTFLSCPAYPHSHLHITLPFLILIVKLIDEQDFSFELEMEDHQRKLRRFRASTFQKETKVTPRLCHMRLNMDEGWNHIQLDLKELMRKMYGTQYMTTDKIQVHANCRLRRIYFSDQIRHEEDLPPEFRLFKRVDKNK